MQNAELQMESDIKVLSRHSVCDMKVVTGCLQEGRHLRMQSSADKFAQWNKGLPFFKKAEQ